MAGEEGALLAEVEAGFLEHSPAAGVGWELMADHLHPTAAGQLLLARAVVAALATAPDPWRVTPQASRQLHTDDEYRRRNGDLPVEQVAVLRAMGALFSAPPMDRGNEMRAGVLHREAEVLWQRLSPGERHGIERWMGGKGSDVLSLNVAEALFEQRDFERARAYYRAARLEEPYTVWGDLWATLRWIRCSELLGQPLHEEERIALGILLDRLAFLAQAPDFSPGLQAFFKGYVYHFLAERDKALAALEVASKDGNIRRQFCAELSELLVSELMEADRFADAERFAVQLAAEQQQQALGRALVERIRARRPPR